MKDGPGVCSKPRPVQIPSREDTPSGSGRPIARDLSSLSRGSQRSASYCQNQIPKTRGEICTTTVHNQQEERSFCSSSSSRESSRPSPSSAITCPDPWGGSSSGRAPSHCDLGSSLILSPLVARVRRRCWFETGLPQFSPRANGEESPPRPTRRARAPVGAALPPATKLRRSVDSSIGI